MRVSIVFLAVLVAACGPQAPVVPEALPAAPSSAPSAEPPVTASASAAIAPPKAPSASIHITTLVVSLADERALFDGTAIDHDLKALAPSLASCFDAEVDGAGAKAWLVARIDGSGSVQGANVATTDLSASSTQCMKAIFEHAKVTAPPSPVAVSFVAVAEPIRAPVAGPPENVIDSVDAATRAQDLGIIGIIGTSGEFSGGGLIGASAGDAFGTGGLGLTGVGSSGGRGDGIGLGSIGTFGHGAGTGSSRGFAKGTHKTSSPLKIRMGATSVSGRLPPEVIQRIVRQNFGRFRLCYENGLRKDKLLGGRVSVAFTIERDGSISSVKSDKATNLPDASVVACVTKAFTNLSFPQPEGGTVKVLYPVLFAPDEAHQADGTPSHSPGRGKPEPPKAVHVAGKTLDVLTADDLAHAIADAFHGSGQALTVPVVALDATPGARFVAFEDARSDIFAVQIVSAPAKDAPPVHAVNGTFAVERIDTTPNGHALRVLGPSDVLASELASQLTGD